MGRTATTTTKGVTGVQIPDNPAITRAEMNGYEPWLMWGYETEADMLADQEGYDDEES